MITRLGSGLYIYGDGSGWKVVQANRREGQGGSSGSRSGLWRKTALLRDTGGGVLGEIRANEIRWLSPFFKQCRRGFHVLFNSGHLLCSCCVGAILVQWLR
jgi:hypothetical protein